MKGKRGRTQRPHDPNICGTPKLTKKRFSSESGGNSNTIQTHNDYGINKID